MIDSDYQQFLENKLWMEFSYNVLLKDKDSCDIYNTIIRATLNTTQERLLDGIFSLYKQAGVIKKKSKQYYSQGESHIGRKLDALMERLYEETKLLSSIRAKLLTEIKLAEDDFLIAQRELDIAFEATITADNEFQEFCRVIGDKSESI